MKKWCVGVMCVNRGLDKGTWYDLVLFTEYAHGGETFEDVFFILGGLNGEVAANIVSAMTPFDAAGQPEAMEIAKERIKKVALAKLEEGHKKMKKRKAELRIPECRIGIKKEDFMPKEELPPGIVEIQEKVKVALSELVKAIGLIGGEVINLKIRVPPFGTIGIVVSDADADGTMDADVGFVS